MPLACLAAALLAQAPTATAQNTMPQTPADVAAAPKDAAKTPSGLASKVLEKGKGTEHPSASDTVTVHYSGWTTDGKMFDSSVQRGEPTSFPLKGVIKGWTEGVQLMVEGEKRRFWIPADLAYGENPGGGRPGGTLVFDIELISIKKGPKAPALKAPADAKKTAAGVAIQTVAKGTGAESPKPEDTVKVQLALWSPDGDLIQSTAQQGGPVDVPLDKFRIGGLSEAIQTMVEGEKKAAWWWRSNSFRLRKACLRPRRLPMWPPHLQTPRKRRPASPQKFWRRAVARNIRKPPTP